MRRAGTLECMLVANLWRQAREPVALHAHRPSAAKSACRAANGIAGQVRNRGSSATHSTRALPGCQVNIPLHSSLSTVGIATGPVLGSSLGELEHAHFFRPQT